MCPIDNNTPTHPPRRRPALVSVDIEGHRGAGGLKPENTLPSFEAALDLGVDTLELDVHLSADDQVVVWHDPYLVPAKCRLASAQPAAPDPAGLAEGAPKLWLRHRTVDELRAYQCDGIPNAKEFPGKERGPTSLAGAGYGLVTLAELFDFVDAYANSEQKSASQRGVASRVRFNIEIKRDPDHPEYIGDGFDGAHAGLLETGVVDLVRAHGLQARVIVQSFDTRSVRAVAALDPSLALAVLEKGPSLDLEQVRGWGVGTWSPHYAFLDAELIARAHDAGLKVVPWPVNELDAMLALAEFGVDGLITDRPDLALR